jgi:hypothetical protein
VTQFFQTDEFAIYSITSRQPEKQTLKAFRRIAILLINAAVLILFVKVVFFDGTSDTAGAFGIVCIIFLFIFNVYALILYNVFWDNPRKLWYLEALYLALLLLPILFVIPLTR